MAHQKYSTSSPQFKEPPTISPPVPSQRNGSEPTEESRGRGRHGAPVIRPKILKLLEESDGRAMYLDDMVKEFNCSPSGIQNAIRSLQQSIPQIVTVIRGQAWKWDERAGAAVKAVEPEIAPAPKPRPKTKITGKLTFVEIGKTQTGALVIESNQGTLYRAEPIN